MPMSVNWMSGHPVGYETDFEAVRRFHTLRISLLAAMDVQSKKTVMDHITENCKITSVIHI